LDLELSDIAEQDLDGMDKWHRTLFIKRFDKLVEMPPRRHFRRYCIENVGAGRIVYEIKHDIGMILVVRCFADHKEYDSWRDAER